MIPFGFGHRPFLRLHGDLDEMREALGSCGPHDAIGHRAARADSDRAEKPRPPETAHPS